MKFSLSSFARGFVKDARGQTLALVAMSVPLMIGAIGVSIDTGHFYSAYHQLVASTDAAVLAGAAALPNATIAAANATAYSSVAGGKNVNANLTNVSLTTTFSCLTTVTNMGVQCIPETGCPTAGCNAMKVVQTASVPTVFAHWFGVPTFTVSATGTAAMAGGHNTPWNIALVVDTTASMASGDSGKQCTGSQIHCAQLGAQALLGLLDPCASSTTCTKTSTPVDSVALFVFPALQNTVANIQKDYVCPTSNPTIVQYQVPTIPASMTYEVVPLPATPVNPFSTDYRTSDTSGLNASSDLVIALGGGGCNGVGAPGGKSTYYAQVIYAAQAALVAQQAANPGSQNAMIILTDGDAEATVSPISTIGTNFASSGANSGYYVANYSSSSDMVPTSNGALNGVPGNNPTSYTYPSAVGECGQAVKAAIDAATNPAYNNPNYFTSVYTIGYGSETSACNTDKTYSGTYTGGGGSWKAGDTACQAMAAMASTPKNFYSDDGNGCVATVPSNQNFTTLVQIFESIAGGLTSPRLIPNGST